MDGASEEFQFPNLIASNPMLAMQKFVTDLQSTVRQKDEHIKQLTDQVSNLTNELKMHKSSDQHIHSRGDIRLQEFKRAIDKAIDDYIINETFPPTQIPQTLDANQPYTTIESEEHAASSSTSTNHTVNHLNHIGNHNHHNHANHESAESDYGRPNEFRTHGCESLDDNPSLRFPNENKPLSIMHSSMLMSPQRRFVSNGLNGTSNNNHNNHNYHNNNNNNRNHNNNNNNNNNRKNQNPKYTVFVSWSAKMDREDLNVLFDPNDVLEIRHSPNKQFAHFDLKNPEAMRKALSYDKTIRNPEHGQLRVEAGKPRSNNTENNNNNNNGQRQQNRNYNNRQQNKQNGNMNGYNQQKPYNKYIPNGGTINGIHNNHPDEISDPSIPPIQGTPVLSSTFNNLDH